MGYISTWMGDRLSSTPAVRYVSNGISLSPQTFVNASAPLVSLMALRSHYKTKTPSGLVLQAIAQCSCF